MVLPKFVQRIFNSERSKTLSTTQKPGQCNCKVILLNDQELELDVKPTAKGQAILNKVLDFVNLVEREYFGLRYLDSSDQQHWLNLKKSIQSQLKSSPPYRLYFGVKFYASDPCKLQEEITRYQFFLQVKQDVVLGRLPVSTTTACELAALALQSEIGNYDPKRHSEDYVSEFYLVQNQTREVEDLIARCHRKLTDIKPATAEMSYLNTVKWLDFYGVDIHNVKGKQCTDYQLGLTPLGIRLYKGKDAIGKFLWPRIVKVTRKNRTFNIRVQDGKNDESVHTFECPSKAACKHLWQCCIEHHQFYRLSAKMASYNTKMMNYEFRKVRRSASGQSRSRTESSSGQRIPPVVVRTPSKRQGRTQSIDSLPSVLPSAVPDEGIVISASDRYTRPDNDGYSSAPEMSKSAPWENGTRRGLFTSGRSSPDSAYRERLMFPGQQRSDVDSEASRGRRRGRRDDDDTDSRNRSRRSRSSRCPADESATESEASYVFRRRKRRSTESVPQGVDPNLGSMTSIVSEASQKRRQRKRSKSPSHKPPTELAQHFRYIDPSEAGISEEQLRDIVFTNVVTESDKPKVKYHPNGQYRHRSPKRRSHGDLGDAETGASAEGIRSQAGISLETKEEDASVPARAAPLVYAAPPARPAVSSNSIMSSSVLAETGAFVQATPGLVCIQPTHHHISQAVHKVKAKPNQTLNGHMSQTINEQMNWTAISHQREDSGISDAGSAFVNGVAMRDYRQRTSSTLHQPGVNKISARHGSLALSPIPTIPPASNMRSSRDYSMQQDMGPPAPHRTVSLYGQAYRSHVAERTADV